MNIRVISSKSEWEAFFNMVGAPSFHQSYAWGEFQKKLGKDIMRLGLYDKSRLIAIALVVKIKSRTARYLFVPHGPLFALPTENLTQTVPGSRLKEIQVQLQAFHHYLEDCARREGFWFIRIAPPMQRDTFHREIFRALDYRDAPLYVHAETMWVIDLSQTEEEMLSSMRKNTRYAIRLALREKLSIKSYADHLGVDSFLRLYHITAKRENFTPYSDTYISEEFQAFHHEKNAKFFVSGLPDGLNHTTHQKYAQEGASEDLAASLIVFTKTCGFYHQGASIHTKYPAAYLLQWHAILESKRRGCRYYSFHGIYDPGRTPRSWSGLSLFKKGFGGFQVNYLYTQDYPTSPLYGISYVADRVLRLKRRI